jgi:hypothetical protein
MNQAIKMFIHARVPLTSLKGKEAVGTQYG